MVKLQTSSTFSLQTSSNFAIWREKAKFARPPETGD
jgi:hypothetical protein